MRSDKLGKGRERPPCWVPNIQQPAIVQDAIALLLMDDLYLDLFENKDVKTLHGDHLSRVIGW